MNKKILIGSLVVVIIIGSIFTVNMLYQRPKPIETPPDNIIVQTPSPVDVTISNDEIPKVKETEIIDDKTQVQYNAPEPIKPPAPSQKPKPVGDVKNPTVTPTYKKEDTVKAKPQEPQAGTKNEKGQVYVPGFGYVNEGSGNVGGTFDSNGDANKQVGNMD